MIEQLSYAYLVNEIPKDLNCNLGVVLSLDKLHRQMHCGLAYNIHDNLSILHLENHNKASCDDNWKEFSIWVKPNVHSLRLEVLVPFLDVIKEKIINNEMQVPYGFQFDEYSEITTNGQLILAKSSIGLTCATFVMTIFHSQGINLIDIENWPYREDDSIWRLKIKGLLLRFASRLHISDSHIAKLKGEQVTHRFRPEEVAVSSALFNEGKPANYKDIWNQGEILNMYMQQL